MKISVLSSTLSCITKCIRFVKSMTNKKIIFALFIVSFLGACASPTAMLGPAYTFTSSGSVFQAGLSYGTNEIISSYTGKTPLENLQEISSTHQKNKKNIQKETLESDDFYNLVNTRIKKTNLILNSSIQ